MRSFGPVLAAGLALAAACEENEERGEPAGQPGPDDASAAPEARVERVVLTGVSLRTVESARSLDLPERDLAVELGHELVQTEWFYPRPGAVPAGYRPRPATLEITLRPDVVEEASHGGRAIVAAVESKLSWEDGSDALVIRENVLAERPLEPEEEVSDGMLIEHVRRAVLSLEEGIVAKEKLRWAPVSELVEVLEEGGVSLSLWALDVIGERELTGALDEVIALLESADPRLSDRAVRTLVALGDPRAVDPLTKSADLSDDEELHTTIEAVSAIGGEDAEQFLEFYASGHDDAEIREHAAEGLERIRGEDE